VPARTDELWTAFGGTLKRFIAKRVPDEHEAEDLLQEVLDPPLTQAL
jgi:DNA-directed RNA polymerase specialized sigma24 family protein